MKNLSLSDLIALQQHCFEESVSYISTEQERDDWNKRRVFVRLVLDKRVEDIFAVPTTEVMFENTNR